MENEARFRTETLPKYYLQRLCKTFLLVAVVFAVIAGLFLQNIKIALLVLVMTLVCMVFMLLVMKNRPPVVLEFYGTHLHIRNMDYREYDLHSLPASDFLFKQNAAEKKANVGRLRIRGTAYEFCGVQNFDQLVEYVNTHF